MLLSDSDEITQNKNPTANIRTDVKCTGCPKKTHFQNAVGATVHLLNHKLPAPLVSRNEFFGRFLLKLSLIKPSQVMYMVKFSPTALNFGYDFVLIVDFFGTSCI